MVLRGMSTWWVQRDSDPGVTGVGFRGKRLNKPWVVPLQALGLFHQDWCKTNGNLGMFRHGRRTTQPDHQLGQTFELLPPFGFRG